MRILHGLLLLTMLLFTLLQLNDPDGLLWTAIYTIPTLTMLVAVLRPQWFRTTAGRFVRWVSVGSMAAAVAYFLPKTSGFWSSDVWWETEAVREGMGVIIAFLVAASAFLIRATIKASARDDESSS